MKRFLSILFSVLFLISLSAGLFADPPLDGGDDPTPPPPIMPGDS